MVNKSKKVGYHCTPTLPYTGNKSIGRVRFLELLKNIKDGKITKYLLIYLVVHFICLLFLLLHYNKYKLHHLSYIAWMSFILKQILLTFFIFIL